MRGQDELQDDLLVWVHPHDMQIQVVKLHGASMPLKGSGNVIHRSSFSTEGDIELRLRIRLQQHFRQLISHSLVNHLFLSKQGHSLALDVDCKRRPLTNAEMSHKMGAFRLFQAGGLALFLGQLSQQFQLGPAAFWAIEAKRATVL